MVEQEITLSESDCATAQRDVYEALQLSQQSTAESLRLAIQKHQEALRNWQKVGDRLFEGATLNNTDNLYSFSDNKQQALDECNQVILCYYPRYLWNLKRKHTRSKILVMPMTTLVKTRFVKQWLVAKLLALLANASIAPVAASQPSCPPHRTYCCIKDTDGVWKTKVVTPRGTATMFYWDATDGLLPELTQEQHCQQVSERLQAYRDQGQLKYISNGSMNGQFAICVAQRKRGECIGILFNLKPGSDAQYIMRQLLRLAPSVDYFEGGSRRFFIDVNDYLNSILSPK